MLQIDQKQSDGVTVLTLSGRLVLGEESSSLGRKIKQLASEQTGQILVNIEDVNYIDSCGVGELISGFTTVRKSGGTLKVCSPRDMVLKVLNLVKLPKVVEVYPTEQEALESFASQ
jgi:anti-sigma B factor antagonist